MATGISWRMVNDNIHPTERGDAVLATQTRESVVVAITGVPGTDSLIRRAARIAERSHGELIGVHVIADDAVAVAASDNLERQRRLLEVLGGTYHEVVGTDIPTKLVKFAQAENATQLILGASGRSRWKELTQGSVINTVIRLSGPIDVHVISHDPNQPVVPGTPRRCPRWPSALPLGRVAAGWAVFLFGIPFATVVLANAREHVSLSTALLFYLLLVMVVSTVGGLWPGLATAATADLCLNWFFTPPHYTWTIADPQNVLALITFLGVAAANSTLVSVAARRAYDAARAGDVAEALATIAGGLLREQDPLPELVERLRVTFGQDAAAVLRRSDTGTWKVEAGAGEHLPTDPAQANLAIRLDDTACLALKGSSVSNENRRVLNAFVTQLALALRGRRLHADAARATALEEANKLRTALLNAVSHDLRTPLASIKAAATSLLDPGVQLPAAATRELLVTVREQTDRLDRLVGNLLDMSRLQAGTMPTHPIRVGLDEIVDAALTNLPPVNTDKIHVDIAMDLPPVSVDSGLAERAVANILANAINWSPTDRPVDVVAGCYNGAVELRIIDRGPGIPKADRGRVFQPFQRLGDAPNGTGVGLGLAVARGFVDHLGGRLALEDTPGGGLTVAVMFPVAET